MGEFPPEPIFQIAVITPRWRSLLSLGHASLAAGIGLAVFAYRDLLRFEPHKAIHDPVERLLFEPSDSTPAVIIVLAAWLVWRRRERWRGLANRSGPAALTLALAASAAAILVWSRLTAADDLLALSLIAAGLALASLFKGAPGVRLLWLPALFLLLALPLPPALANAVIFQFQVWTAELAGELLFWFGIPAHVAGVTILRSDYTFSVIEACSGLRSVTTLSMLAVLMVDLFRRRGWHALLLVLAAPFVAFALNGVRAIALILNPHSEIAAVHAAQGVAILLGGLLVLYALDGGLARVFPSNARSVSPAAAAASASALAARRRIALGFLTVLALGSVGVARWVVINPPPLGIVSRYAKGIGAWRGETLAVDPVFLGSVTFRESLRARYQQEEDSVELFIGVGDRDRRFVSPLSPKTELLDATWVVEEESAEPAGRPAARQLVLRSGTRWLLVEHWVVGGGGIVREALRSLLTLDATPWRKATDPIVIRLATPLHGPGALEKSEAGERLHNFRVSLDPEIERLVQEMENLSRSARRKGIS